MDNRYFLNLIKGCLLSNPVPLDENFDEEVFCAFKEHGISNFLYSTYKEDRFKKSYLKDLYACTVQDSAFLEVTSALSGKEILHVVMKGAVLRKLYPNSLMRTMGDFDFLLKKDDLQKATLLMKEIGYDCEQTTPTEYTFTKGIARFEFHTSLINEQEKSTDFFDDAFEHLKKVENYTYTFIDEYHFAFLVYHLARHTKEAGAGIRPYIDLGLFLQKVDIDVKVTKEYLTKLNLWDFFLSSLNIVCEVYPYNYRFTKTVLSKDIFNEYIFKVVNYGVHGGGQNNDPISNNRNATKKGSFSYFIKKCFPSYKFMAFTYGYVKKCPLLLPVGYVHRLIASLFNNKAKRILKSSTSKEQKNFFKEIGL